MSKKVNNVLPALIFLFGLLVFVSMFFDVLKNSDGDALMTGVTATFGGDTSQFFGIVYEVNFSFMNALAFLLPGLLSIVFMVIASNNRQGSSVNLFFGVLLTVAFALSVTLLFQLPANTTHSLSAGGSNLTQNFADESLAIGGILGYAFGIAGGFLSLIYTATQFRK